MLLHSTLCTPDALCAALTLAKNGIYACTLPKGMECKSCRYSMRAGDAAVHHSLLPHRRGSEGCVRTLVLRYQDAAREDIAVGMVDVEGKVMEHETYVLRRG